MSWVRDKSRGARKGPSSCSKFGSVRCPPLVLEEVPPAVLEARLKLGWTDADARRLICMQIKFLRAIERSLQ